METRKIETDVLIIGGGTAGCFAAITLGRRSDCRVLIAEKANIERSGCLAAGVNAVNAYITEGHEPQFYVDYAKRDAAGIVREDLLRTMSERLNHVTAELEDMGLVILKDKDGRYVNRGPRNIKINGENIKLLLAKETGKQKNVAVLNHVNITDLKITTEKTAGEAGKIIGTDSQDEEKTVRADNFAPGSSVKIAGAYGFSVNAEIFYDISAQAVLVACGGAAGLYRPNNPGFSRHKMWYPPFNTGGGYAMGIRAGAEMTTFEMRFIALRCKDTIAPTGTIAQGVGAKQVNAAGEVYETKYGLTTSERVWGTTMEISAGRGPCYLRTEGIGRQQEEELLKAYLNMAPAQTLKWMEAGMGPAGQNVEIEGTEPYVVGGHAASGYWVDAGRRTTLPGLYAAGDVAGGCPQKYVTGALAEGEIAAETILDDFFFGKCFGAAYEDFSEKNKSEVCNSTADQPDVLFLLNGPEKSEEKQSIINKAEEKKKEYEDYLNQQPGLFSVEELEEAMQKVMDVYAGGISANYRYSAAGLLRAEEEIRKIEGLTNSLSARDMDDLLQIYELKERLTVCRVLIAHLGARKETRWHSFGENADCPRQSDDWLRYVNSRMADDEIEIIYRALDY